MARYRMSDDTIVDTRNATLSFEEDTYFDGSNHISRATGTQWNHQTLYRSRKGRYYLESSSQWQGSRPSAEWISNEGAARWLIQNNRDLPEELQRFEDEVTE